MNPYLDDPDVTLYQGDAVEVLSGLPAESVHMCVTSPPFYGLRDYNVDGQIGLEETPERWVESLVAVFREVRRVLRADGTLWLEVGDSYASTPAGNTDATFSAKQASNPGSTVRRTRDNSRLPGVKPKDLIGAPWLLAFALRADGWYLRSEIIWAKKNCMPESVSDRPTTAHSRVFLLAKSPRYFFDAEAVREPLDRPDLLGAKRLKGVAGLEGQRGDVGRYSDYANPSGRNVRSVWEIATQPFPEAHFATFPQALVRRCILAGSAEGGTVLDPFMGSGTTAVVARKHDRKAIGIDLNGEYLDMASRRLSQQSLFA